LASTDRLSESDQTRMDYWNELMRYMRRRNSLIMFNEPNSNRPHQLRAKADTFGSDQFILVALANVRPELRIGVGVEISGPREYYTALEKDAPKIMREIGYERAAGQELEWHPKTKVRDVWLYRRADFFERKQWSEQHEWLCEKLEVFRRVLRPRIIELLRAIS
jgi:hypothetical protein